MLDEGVRLRVIEMKRPRIGKRRPSSLRPIEYTRTRGLVCASWRM
jgi:hypothetical protein